MKRREKAGARGKAGAARRAVPARAAAAPAPALPLSHPAMLAAALVAVACLMVSVTFLIDDPDLWQHLRVGRAIWETHSIPMTQVWCWPTYGEPQVLPSWAFRALLWPFWQLGAVPGIFTWRWLATLAAFGFGFAAARRMGARGLTPFLVAVVAGLTWRHRAQLRPETLAAVLIAAQIWILETRRGGGPDRWWALVAIACLYANAHLSYYFGLTITGAYALDDLIAARTRRAEPPPRDPRRLWWVLLASCAASFVNPFGWRALWQPFDYFLHGRHELIYHTIEELAPIEWGRNLTNGLPLVLAAWAALALWRWRRVGLDLAELLVGGLFVVFGIGSQRFLGLAAVVAFPYLARDLDAWIGSRAWPAWSRPAAARAALVAGLSVLACVPEWRVPATAFGIGIQMKYYPVGACTYVERAGVRGHAFNQFYEGGYMLWRFWPQRDRLPFMDIHQTGTPRARELLARAASQLPAWRELQQEWDFDWALVDRRAQTGPWLLNFLADDSTWTPVFMDDAAVVFVKAQGPLAAIARRDGYRRWPAGWSGVTRLMTRWNSDPEYRRSLKPELERQVAASPWNSLAHNYLALMALADHDDATARPHLEAALRVEPKFPNAHAMLGRIALRAGHRDQAAREFAAELRINPSSAGVREALESLRGGGP